MSDDQTANNPGLDEVEDEVYARPDPNGGTVQYVPRQTGALVPVADQARKPPTNGVSVSAFPTPAELSADAPVFCPSPTSSIVPPAPEVIVANQCLTGINTPEFVVQGPAETFQTNTTDQDVVTLTVAGVFDADRLPAAPSAATTRYYLTVAVPPLLTSYPVSLLGRQLVFATGADEGAARFITGYGSAFIVVDRDDPSEDNGGVPTLVAPSPGDTFTLDVCRKGPEQVWTPGETVEVFVSPPPPPFLPDPPQALQGGGTSFVSLAQPPGTVLVEPVGTGVPSAVEVDVASQVYGSPLPPNVYQ